MNTFGRIFKLSIFGESHGACVGITIDGIPAGVALSSDDFILDMERRKGGKQKGATPRQEEDMPEFLSGCFNGYTTGAPLTMIFPNKNTRSEDYQKHRSHPRPSHADFVAHEKYGGYEDFRGGGHFSARLTTGIVAAGIIAKKILGTTVHIHSKIIAIGGESDLERGLQLAIDAKDSIGGLIECRVNGLPLGLGEPFFDSIESVLAHALFAIPAVKGVEFGAGFQSAQMFGLQHNDAIIDAKGTTKSNHAGGIVGGISNGNELVFRLAVKPTASTPQKQTTWNWDKQLVDEFTVKGRHDLCVALRAPVIVEAMTAIVLVDFMLLENKVERVIK